MPEFSRATADGRNLPSAGRVVPTAPIDSIEALWVQITGTLCNLRCTHCFISCAPDNDALAFMSCDQIKTYLDEAEAIGVKEVYFTGGEPLLHPHVLAILQDSLDLAPTTMLTNGVLITEHFAERLGEISIGSRYSLEIRVSLDAPDADANDVIRGPGVFDRAVRGLIRLQRAGLMPIVTATELVVDNGHLNGGGPPQPVDLRRLPSGVEVGDVGPAPRADSFYARFHRVLSELGVERPRVKILPVFNMGNLEDRRPAQVLTKGMVKGFDLSTLQCSASRLVAADGVYACPILAGEPAARMSLHSLTDSLYPVHLYHPSCTTCYQTGMTCRNF